MHVGRLDVMQEGTGKIGGTLHGGHQQQSSSGCKACTRVMEDAENHQHTESWTDSA